MRTQIITAKYKFQNIGSSLFNIGLLAGVATLSFGLISCGGGGGSSTAANNPASTDPTISYITAIPAASGVTGIIAASAAQALTIWGTNFVSGVSITITNSSGTPYTTTLTAVPKSTKITTNVTISSVPNDSYVTVTVTPPTGIAASGILGVAHAYKKLGTDIQPIFDANGCGGGCHSGNPALQGGMNLTASGVSASSLIQKQKTNCTSSAQFRVNPGDPRRASNALIDVLRAKNSTTTVVCQMPSGSASAVSATELEAIVDWIALGAN